MTENALDKRREYQRKYYKEHQKEITTRQNNWRKENQRIKEIVNEIRSGFLNN